MENSFKLNQFLKTPQERIEQITALLENSKTKPSTKTLEKMTDYIFGALSSKEQKALGLLSENSLNTVKKREVSFEGLLSKFENSEDMLQNFLSDNKNTKLTQKKSVTEKDIETIPGLKKLRSTIDALEELYKTAKGRNKYLIKKQIIELRQEQQILKSQYSGGHNLLIRQKATSIYAKSIAQVPLDEHIQLDENQEPVSDGLISFFNKRHILAILSNYSGLKQEVETKLWNDLYYLMIDFDNLADEALKPYPLYEAIVTYKIDGYTNAEIADKIEAEFGIRHTPEYISSLWNNKIPKIIAEKAKENYIMWYFTYVEKGQWKKCSKCGQIKLAHNRFFSKNKSSKDGFYSICKECRNKKRKGADLFNGDTIL